MVKQLQNYYLDDTLEINSFFSKEELPELIEYQLHLYYSEVNFMVDDPIYQRTLNLIKSHPIASEIWSKIINSNPILVDESDRVVNFQIGPVKASFKYHFEHITFSPRFTIVE